MKLITKEHILKAIQEIDNDGVRPGRNSSTYDLIFKEKEYPPKYVISLANKYATGEELDHNSFSGGEGTPAFNLLKNEGSVIKNKIDLAKSNTSKFSEAVSEFIEYLKISDSIISAFTFGSYSTRSKYVWISDQFNNISDTNCHYELIERKQVDGTKGISAEIHFEDKYKKEYFSLLTDILPADVYLNEQHKPNISFAYKNIIDYSDPNFFVKLEAALAYLELELGSEVRKIKNKMSAKNFKNDFIKWFISNDGKENNYFTQQFGGSTDRFTNEVNKYEDIYRGDFDSELFIINPNNLKEKIEELQENIYSNSPGFSEYSQGKSNGRPKAILGRNNYMKFLKDIYFSSNREDAKIERQNTVLNQILYGPPGTGKTYKTIDKAISIANSEFDLSQDRTIVKAEYDRLVEIGQIVFTTFHQSMSYEDFIEGIKPQIEEDTEGNKTVTYDIEDGIFKKIVGQAKKIDKVNRTDIDWNNVNYYKMSLGGKNNPQEHSYCIHNNLGGISWGGNNDLSDLVSIKDWSSYKKKFLEMFPKVTEKSTFHIQASFALLRMKEGDIVVATRGNHIIDAIGRVNGDYVFNDENPTSLSHFRKIDWFAKDLNSSPERFLKKNISQQSIYQFYNEDIKLESFKELTANDSSPKNYVLIIDEINRGNVSQIFGELITLIEENKRLGKEESLEVTLSYSKTKFGVPSNLYIIGTMNTADRSVEALDTALRRRFSFTEMGPELAVVEKKKFTDYLRVDIMQKINQRIELLLDKNYTLGHSYFIKEDFKGSFKNEIIPLLQEYFYNDCGKIGLILGRGFVREKEISKANQQNVFADFDTRNDIEIIKSYELIPFEEIDFNSALESLLV